MNSSSAPIEDTDGKKHSAERTCYIPDKKVKLLFGVLVFLCVCFVFYKPLFKGAAISRFSLIEDLDILYNPSLKNSEVSAFSQDPSACLQFIPREFLVQELIGKKELPIWNPYTGCGQPIMADPANTLFSPIDLLFASRDSWDTGIVIKILVGVLSSYALFLRYGASPWAAATASLGFALSARVLRTAELTSDSLPLVFLVFACLPVSPNITRILLCAVALALTYTTIHPEIFFITVLCASALWIWNAWAERPTKSSVDESTSQPNVYNYILSSSLSFLGLGIVSSALVSPIIFSFLEYLREAASYKYTDASMQFISLLQFPFFMALPKLAGTIFPGWITLLGIVASAFFNWKQRNALFSVALILILFACRPAFLEPFLSRPPFSFLLPEYALGTLLLILCICSAVGLSKLCNQNTGNFFKIALISFICVIVPQTLLLSGFSIPGVDSTMTAKGFIVPSLLLALSIGLMQLIARFASINTGNSSKGVRTGSVLALIAMIAIPVINFATMIPVVNAELPVTRYVPLPPKDQKELIEKLQSFKNARITACGDRLLAPNTALLYRLEDLRTCSPLNNKRYLKFMEAMGAKLGYCNMIQVPYGPNKLLDFASVQYLLASAPVAQSTSVKGPESHVSGRIVPGLRLVSADSFIDLAAAEISSDLRFRVHKNLASRYQFQEILRTKDGKVVWQSPFQWFAPEDKEKRETTSSFQNSIKVPVPYQSGIDLELLLRIRDTWTGESIVPDGNSLQIKDGYSIVLMRQSTSELISEFAKYQTGQERFSIVHESPELIRIYKNNRALPRAYMVHHTIIANNGDDALKLISYPEYNGNDTVILELDDLGEKLEQELEGLGLSTKKSYRFKSEAAPPDDKVEITARTSTTTDFICNSESPGILVLTDTFYPGWKASVDGKEARVLRANYLFRAIVFPSGRHKISVSYNPFPIYLSQLMIALVAFTLGTLAIISNLFRKKSQSH